MPNTANYIVDFFGDLIWATTGVESAETMAKYLGCGTWTVVVDVGLHHPSFPYPYRRRIGNWANRGNWHTP